jgi:altronate hydrolase
VRVLENQDVHPNGSKIQNEIIGNTSQVPMSLKDLAIGCECGWSATTSGLTGDSLAGVSLDRLVEFAGQVELVGLLRLLQVRAATTGVKKELAKAYSKLP